VAYPVPPEHLLATTRRALDSDTVVLSFHLGQAASWLWAVDRDGAALYRLPAAASLKAALERLSRAVVQDAAIRAAGCESFQALFGPLAARYRSKPRWLLALDGDLHQAPLAALTETAGGVSRYLVEGHSLEVIPAVSFLWQHNHRPRPGNGFVGVGDAIYNAADPRRPQPGRGSRWWQGFGLGRASAASESPLLLPRLVASGNEVAGCARSWPGPAILLTGEAATRAQLQAALDTRPAIVHIAAHFLQSAESRAYGLLALSLDRSGRTEVVAPHEIARWRTDADLVVLSGCSSAAGVFLPGTGVFGLTRAWLAAGAGQVVATRWSTPDDDGALFRSLYGHLAKSPLDGAAAALAQAQRGMIAAGGWRSRPAYWAAFFAAGTARRDGMQP
jgi:CHAT domain-containing protein